MKKVIVLAIVALFGFAGVSYAKPCEDSSGGCKNTVTSDSEGGNKGDIFTSTGEGNQGTWIDRKEFKGDKGDTGATGTTGSQGIQGVAGLNGVNGSKGDKGDAGKDVDPSTVTNLEKSDAQLQDNINKNNTTLNNRINDTNSRVSKLEQTQNVVVGKVRVYDSRKIQVNTFVTYSATRNTVSEAGVEVTWKLGSSYEERRADELEARLNKLEGIKDVKEKESSTQLYTTANGMGIKNTF
jgi:hypothetical protein